MAFEIFDGMTGTKHISSDDLSALNIAAVGRADCVLEYGDDFALTMQSANSATLGTGVGMVGGKRFWNQAATSLTIQSGTQGQKRNDIIVARYAKTSSGIESITPVVIKGTPTTGTAEDPEVTANDLKMWRVPLDGISVGEPVKLFDPVASLATLGDSVSPTTLFASDRGSTESISLSEPVSSFQFVDILYGRGRSTRVCPSRDRKVILSDHVYSKANNAHYISSEMIEVSGSSIARSISGNCGRLIITGKDIQADLSGLQAITAVFGYR